MKKIAHFFSASSHSPERLSAQASRNEHESISVLTQTTEEDECDCSIHSSQIMMPILKQTQGSPTLFPGIKKRVTFCDEVMIAERNNPPFTESHIINPDKDNCHKQEVSSMTKTIKKVCILTDDETAQFIKFQQSKQFPRSTRFVCSKSIVKLLDASTYQFAESFLNQKDILQSMTTMDTQKISLPYSAVQLFLENQHQKWLSIQAKVAHKTKKYRDIRSYKTLSLKMDKLQNYVSDLKRDIWSTKTQLNQLSFQNIAQKRMQQIRAWNIFLEFLRDFLYQEESETQELPENSNMTQEYILLQSSHQKRTDILNKTEGDSNKEDDQILKTEIIRCKQISKKNKNAQAGGINISVYESLNHLYRVMLHSLDTTKNNTPRLNRIQALHTFSTQEANILKNFIQEGPTSAPMSTFPNSQIRLTPKRIQKIEEQLCAFEAGIESLQWDYYDHKMKQKEVTEQVNQLRLLLDALPQEWDTMILE